ncbi:MAG: universal stress protein [Pseudomonadota bacterium]
MRTIMIPVADRPECATALGVTFELAQKHSLDVLGYHLRPHKLEKKSAAKQVDLASKAAEKLFERLAGKYGINVSRRYRYNPEVPQACWRALTGSPEKRFPSIGPMSDLIVVSRPKSSRSVLAREFQYAALMYTGTPVLTLPSRMPATLGQRVLIAWNQSIEAAKAVKAAMPLLRGADAVNIAVAGQEDQVGAKSSHLQQYLRHHGVNAKRIVSRGDDVNAEIRDAYDTSNSDLLVMGAYSRPRWRERVFGGLTDYIVNKTSLPTILLHS